MEKCVHTEHCCAEHGCKYFEEDCPVVTGQKPQSYPCEDCQTNQSPFIDPQLVKAQAQARAHKAAIDYALDGTGAGAESSMLFLGMWRNGDPDKIKQYFPDFDDGNYQ